MLDRLSEAQARSAVYRLFSRAFLHEPTVSFLDSLAHQSSLRVLCRIGGKWMADLLGEDREALVVELGAEYVRLFVGPGFHVHPFESLYVGTGSEGQLYGEPAIAVEQFYREAGFSPSPSFRVLPDHIGVELECMSHLAAREALLWKAADVDAATATLRLQGDFLRRHLTHWLPKFDRQLRRFEPHPFYRTLATAACRFVRVDSQALDEIPGGPIAPRTDVVAGRKSGGIS